VSCPAIGVGNAWPRIQENCMSLPVEEHEVILGVDTHLDMHVAVLIDEVGRVVATDSFPTTTGGYEKLIEWVGSFGRLSRAGVEGTGAYGAGLARHMQERGVKVLEINRPDRSRRRLRGKSDPTDAENAARAVLAGEAHAIPKAQSGVVEAMRAVSMARRSAVKAKTQAINQLRALLVTAPASIRATLWKGKPEQCVARCARLQSLGDTPLLKALRNTLRLLARRWLNLAKELRELDAALEKLTKRRPSPSCTIRRRAANGRHLVGNRGRQSRSTAQRSRTGCVVRRESVGGVLWKDDATSPQSWWRSRRQQRAVDHLNGKNEERPAHPRLRCPPNRRRSIDEGDSTMPEASHCSRAVSADLVRLGGCRSSAKLDIGASMHRPKVFSTV
jgi:transposase